MAAAVSRKEVDLAAGELAADDYIRRRSKWGLDMTLCGIGEGIDLIDSATPDHTDGWLHGAGLKHRSHSQGRRKPAVAIME